MRPEDLGAWIPGVTRLEYVCDCSTKDALVCKEHPDCRPSYCKMTRFDMAKMCVTAESEGGK